MEEKIESLKLSKNTSAKTYAKIAMGAGIVKFIFTDGFVGGLIGEMIGDFALILVLVSGITALVKNKEKDRNVRAMVILGIVFAFAGIAILVIVQSPR